MAKADGYRGTPTPSIPPSPVSFKGSNKGQLSLKSSPYSSSNTRALNQHDVVNNLNVHYKKLGSAKSRIDSTVPKSWSCSTIKRDQLRRQAIEKQLKKSGAKKRPSRPSSRNTVAGNADDFNIDLDEDLAKYGITDQPMTPTKAYRPHSSFSERQHPDRTRTSQSQMYNQTRTNESQLYDPYRSTKSLERTGGADQRSRTPRKDSGDLLDKRADKFRDTGKLHTPRTLKTTATSRLAQSRNYNPPKRGKSKGSNKGLNDTGRTENSEHLHDEYARNLESREQLDELERRNERENARLQLAEDKLRWVEEQAARVQSLNLDDHQEEGVDHVDGVDLHHATSTPLHPGRPPRGRAGGKTPLGGTKDLNVSYGNQSLRSELASMTYRTQEQVSQRMQEEEEELRYLEFVTDVTNDVLNRGIYTNKVLKQVFESHIDKNKGRLHEGRMRHLMKQLQEDLAIPETDAPDSGT